MKTQLFLVTTLAAASLSMFGQAPAAKVDPAVRHTQMLTKMLSLTPDQQTQVQALLTAEEATLAPYQSQLQTDRTNLLAAIKANDQNQIASITSMMASPRQQVDTAHASTAAKIYALLTADQQAKVNNGVEMLAGMGGRGGQGGPGGFGPGMHRGGRPQ